MGVAQATVKETRSVGPKDGGNAQPKPLAPPTGQPMGSSVAAALHPPVEAHVRGVAQVESEGIDHPIRDLGEQILDSLQASVAQGQRQVTIRLQPPELGMVLVRLREQGEQLDGTLEVTETQTRRQIEQALPEVIRSLHDAGVVIRRLDVISAEPSAQDPGRGLSQYDPGSGQYGSGYHRDHFPTSQTMCPPPAGDYPVDSSKTPTADRRMMATRGQIDVLL